MGLHVSDLLRRIDEWGEIGERRAELRFLALVHDVLKLRVKDWLPRSGENHHATRARRFAERYVDDERLLASLELHDRPYSIWRWMRRKSRRAGQDERARAALGRMLDRIPDHDLFLRFVELDGSTDGKDPAPVAWLRAELAKHNDPA